MCENINYQSVMENLCYPESLSLSTFRKRCFKGFITENEISTDNIYHGHSFNVGLFVSLLSCFC